MEIVLLILGIVGFLSLSRRISRLEGRGEVLPRPEVSSTKQEQGAKMAGPPLPYVSMGRPFTEAASPWSDKFIAWLKEDWLLKLGALLILIGFGWFVTYAFLHDWIGPVGRITLGLIAGALIMVLGFWRIQKYIHQGGVFIVLGSTTVLLTTFAARQLYGFFNPGAALALMFMSTLLVAFASVRYQSRVLAFASLILAGIAPLLTNSTDPTHIGLFSYLLIVVLASLWVTALRGWRELVTAALVVVTLYSIPDLLDFGGADPGVILLFIYAFAAIFFVAHTLGILKYKDKSITPDLVTASGNGLLLLAWIWMAAPEEWRSLIISAWMVVFAVGGFSIFRATNRKEPFYIYLGVGVAMLAAATAAQLEGAALTIAYTIESTFIPIIAYVVLKKREECEVLSMLLLGPIILSLGSIDASAWRTSVFHRHFFVLLILSLALFLLGGFFARVKEKAEKSMIAVAAFVAGSMYAYALLWLSLHAALQNDNTAVMISLVVYTIVGLTTYFYGRVNDAKKFLTYGGALLVFVVGRLLLVDVWQMELTWRIITFFLVGALLVSTAFVGRKQNQPSVAEAMEGK